MIEISNKVLGILFGIFITVSVISLFMWGGGITSMAIEENETGNVTANVIADIDINATDEVIEFGDVLNLYINRSEDPSLGDNITIEILGNTVTDIDYWGNSSLFAKLNGTVDIDNNGNIGDGAYQIRILDAGGCGTIDISTYTNVSIGFGNVSNLITDCNKNDEFAVGIQINVPQYEPTGQKAAILYFRAVEYTG